MLEAFFVDALSFARLMREMTQTLEAVAVAIEPLRYMLQRPGEPCPAYLSPAQPGFRVDGHADAAPEPWP